MFKELGKVAINKKLKQRINIYCNEDVYYAIKGVTKYVLQKKIADAIFEYIDFEILKDGDKFNINGIEYTFFDIHAKGDKQYGFECVINGKKVVFLGDENMNPILSDRVKNSDYVMHEAFCLDSEEHIFGAYEKNHSTAKSAATFMNKLNIKNLILYHTEESHGKDRKMLYENEAKEVFNGNIIVPNDLETIEL